MQWQCLDAADYPGECILCGHQVSAVLDFVWDFFFFLQRNSHVKLICMSHGSCLMGRRLIVPSVCTSPVPACTQGISDLLVIPEAHSHSKVWFVFDVQNGSSL